MLFMCNQAASGNGRLTLFIYRENNNLFSNLLHSSFLWYCMKLKNYERKIKFDGISIWLQGRYVYMYSSLG